MVDTRTDLGDYMEKIFETLPKSTEPPLTLDELRKFLAEYSLAKGEEKVHYFGSIISRATSKLEIKYLTRLLQNSLLIGVGEGRINIILFTLLRQEGISRFYHSDNIINLHTLDMFRRFY